jgi:hypothetical protein
MLLRIKYETKLKLEASIKLIIPFIIEVHIATVVLLLSLLLADAVALDSVTDVAHRLSLLVMTLRRRRGGGTVVTVVTAFLAQRLDVKQVDDLAVGRHQS